MKRIIIVLAGFLFLAPLTLAGVAQATAPSGVTSTTLGRISLGPYHQTSAGFKIFAKDPTDTVVTTTTIAPGGSTGWHSHPGPVLVQVVSGAVTLRHAAHGRCLSEVVRAGHGFFETPGAVHNAANQRLQPAVVYATFVLPPGAPPEVSAPIPAPCH